MDVRRLGFLTILGCVCLAAAASLWSTFSQPPLSTAQVTPTVEGHRHHADCVHEPRLPELIQIEADASHPGRYQVRIKPEVQGRARLQMRGVRSAQPLAQTFSLQRGGASRTFAVDVVQGRGAVETPAIELVLEDEHGREAITVRREIVQTSPTLKTEAVGEPAYAVRAHSGEGRPLLIHVAPGAPQPRQQSDVQSGQEGDS